MEYKFSSEIWLYSGQGVWYFVTLPKDISAEIKTNFGQGRPGWGSIPVTVTINDIRWTTSIFPDKKSSTYLLPLKAEIRKKANLNIGDTPNLRVRLNI